ncbi:MAG: alpha/beta fold hydrolase [Candidatus Solibacter sp.]
MVRTILFALVLAAALPAEERVTFPTSDGGTVCADLSGKGPNAVVLAHGGRFNKESWRPQAKELAAKGFHVLAFDFRGTGCSTGPGQEDFYGAPVYKDVLAAVHYMKAQGAKTMAVVGGSYGGAAAGDASIQSEPGEIDRIVLLAAVPNLPAEKLKSRTLFLVAREDASDAGPRLPGILAQYEKAPRGKKLVIVEGSAHAQFLFQTKQGARVMTEILRFLATR